MCESNQPPADKFESVTCPRCLGSGQYSYCQRYGHTCFKCSGAKNIFTKRGAAAYKFYQDLCSKKISELVVGDAIPYEGKFARITEIKTAIQKGSSLVDGVMMPYEIPRLDVVTCRCQHGFLTLSDTIRVAQTAEQLKAKKAQAFAYQATLTKSGTVRKTK